MFCTKLPSGIELYHGPPVEFVMLELELGKRAACWMLNETSEGFGAWIPPSVFAVNFDALDTMADWIPDPITHVNPVKFPNQRKPGTGE